jgi:hypothetical protein
MPCAEFHDGEDSWRPPLIAAVHANWVGAPDGPLVVVGPPCRRAAMATPFGLNPAVADALLASRTTRARDASRQTLKTI